MDSRSLSVTYNHYLSLYIPGSNRIGGGGGGVPPLYVPCIDRPWNFVSTLWSSKGVLRSSEGILWSFKDTLPPSVAVCRIHIPSTQSLCLPSREQSIRAGTCCLSFFELSARWMALGSEGQDITQCSQIGLNSIMIEPLCELEGENAH